MQPPVATMQPVATMRTVATPTSSHMRTVRTYTPDATTLEMGYVGPPLEYMTYVDFYDPIGLSAINYHAVQKLRYEQKPGFGMHTQPQPIQSWEMEGLPLHVSDNLQKCCAIWARGMRVAEMYPCRGCGRPKWLYGNRDWINMEGGYCHLCVWWSRYGDAFRMSKFRLWDGVTRNQRFPITFIEQYLVPPLVLFAWQNKQISYAPTLIKKHAAESFWRRLLLPMRRKGAPTHYHNNGRVHPSIMVFNAPIGREIR